MKAILLNGAVDMFPGQYGTGNTQEIPALWPNNVTGWGRVDLMMSLAPPAPRSIWGKDDAMGLYTGSAVTYKLVVGSPPTTRQESGETIVTPTATPPSDTPTPTSTPTATPTTAPPLVTPTTTPTTPPSAGGPFRVILAWTDYPGQPAAGKALVNDLHLEVIDPDGAHYYGNQGLYSGGQCLGGGKWDTCNNVEGVIIPSALDGTYTVIVHGANVPQGGSQPFALVASGDDLREEQYLVYLPLLFKNQ